MKTELLTIEELTSLKDHVRRTIASRAKDIRDCIDSYSTQYCWSIFEGMREDFELLNKLDDIMGE